ncbi:glycyl-radical enzyme activating protein [Intestinibacter sp.]
MSIKGNVVRIQRFSVNDGDGIRTTVFLEGCPLKCRWCSNPDSWSGIVKLAVSKDRCVGCERCVNVCPQKITSLFDREQVNEKCDLCGECIKRCTQDAISQMTKEMTTDEVIKEIEKDFIFFLSSGGGVTFSGGEPTYQLEFLRELVYFFYKKGIYTAIETCALFDFEKCKDVFEKLDHIFVDIKNMDDDKHKEYTGISNKKILENIKKMATLNKSMVIRVPVIPGFNDSIENIEETAKFVKENVGNPKIELLPYHMLGLDKYKALGLFDYIYKFKVPTKEKMTLLENAVKNCGVEVIRYK